MKPFDKCHVCGGPLAAKTVEKIVRGGTDTAILHVEADVCEHCGERLYSEATVRKFEEIRRQLTGKETVGLVPVGCVYEVAQ